MVTLDSEKISEGTLLTLTVNATSNSPVEWFQGSFYGPHGNIWGHGYSGMFTEISPGHYTERQDSGNTISDLPPDTYTITFKDISDVSTLTVPPDITVDIIAGAEETKTGTYTFSLSFKLPYAFSIISFER